MMLNKEDYITAIKELDVAPEIYEVLHPDKKVWEVETWDHEDLVRLPFEDKDKFDEIFRDNVNYSPMDWDDMSLTTLYLIECALTEIYPEFDETFVSEAGFGAEQDAINLLCKRGYNFLGIDWSEAWSSLVDFAMEEFEKKYKEENGDNEND